MLLRRCMISRQIRSTLSTVRPDGTKKAYVRLTPDYDALDVANKIGIIYLWSNETDLWFLSLLSNRFL
ncbi:unnamed protein product [Brassica oleracea var. botrytis]